MSTKKFHIVCRDTETERYIEAEDAAHAANQFASKYYRDFYPPFAVSDHRWCVCNSMCERYFKVHEV